MAREKWRVQVWMGSRVAAESLHATEIDAAAALDAARLKWVGSRVTVQVRRAGEARFRDKDDENE